MRVGFIAMSGVRAHNEELTELGLTLPGFVERNKIIASLPSLSLLTLAALTPKEFEVEYVEVADLNEEDSLRDDCDLVAISSYSAQIYEAYELADRYRRRNVPVVMGGLHVTALPEEAREHCTSVVVGEGEALWSQVLADLRNGGLQPYYVQSPLGSYDLMSAPIPRYDLLDPDKYNRLTVQTSRGCPHRCEFCASSILLSPKYKLKPVSKVLEEIQAIKRIWDRPFIEFADDNTFVDFRHSKELLRALIKEKVRWFTETDISVARDSELLSLMRDSGCKMVLIGLESTRKESLDGIELNANWKMRQQEDYIDAIARIQSYGIRVIGCFVLGLDGDTPQIFGEVHNFVKDSGLYDVQITFQTAFPGTPLYNRLKREGRIIRARAWELCTLFDINHVPKNMTVEELQNGFLWLAETLYSTEETEERRENFKRMLRSSPNFGRRAQAI
ncbi:radical SAM protein [Candidatus Bipolaricaulota bacterium]|nr:radical SAM protein [Candidatus Bipolaricaulota bacterium]